MKPQPMSDEEIDAMLLQHGASGDWTDDEFESAASLVAKAIAARDAQWAAMIGEPVAWGHEAFVGGSWVLQWPVRCSQSSAKEDCAMYGKAETLRVSPLYAIKETP